MSWIAAWPARPGPPAPACLVPERSLCLDETSHTDNNALMLKQTKPDPVRSPLLDKAASQGIRHGYFTRIGGVSSGIYEGLNIGTGSNDDQALVAENRARVAAWMGVPASHLLTAWQIHSADVIVAREPFAGERPKADAIVTDRPGVAVAASTADCGPVLFADAEARIIGAAHAGWKGAFTGVLENTILAMEGLGARRERIVAVLGPSIGPDNYEVGPEFVARFVEADAANILYFEPSANAGHSMFDLNRYTIDRLAKAGVIADGLGRCTYAEEELFYSYRRTTHRKEPDYGRQVSAIVLEKD
jgi:YfiH family protein